MRTQQHGKPGWRWWCALLWVWGVVHAVGASGEDFDHDHGRWAEVLQRHVKGGVVDYAGIQRSPGPLKHYLDDLARVTRVEFDTWNRTLQVAFLVNLYNAATVDLVVAHYPVKSIRDIGSLLKGPWKQDVVRLWGAARTLDHVEHDLLRKRYAEPRVHFALVCGARSCPPLRGEPYVGGRLEAQLEDQGRVFLAQTSKNRIDEKARVLHLSPIFDWFKADFVATGKTLPEFVAPYFPDGSPRRLQGYAVRYTDYDWRLNDRVSD